MDKEREEEIVRTFFVKRLQDRVIFELSTSQKRKDGIWRLCHDSEEKLIDKYMIEIPKPNSDYIEIVNLLKKYGADRTCYCISINDDIDGKYLPISEAIDNSVNFGLASLISCIPNKLAYFQEEQSYGPPKRFILFKN